VYHGTLMLRYDVLGVPLMSVINFVFALPSYKNAVFYLP
jgi:hypothetical protein